MLFPAYFEDPHALHIGTQPPRAYFIPFSDAAAAKAAAENGTARRDSDRFQLLSGTWDFRYFTSVYDVEEPFWKNTADRSAFGKLPVPSVWQLHGYDVPQYTNMDYPFPYDPPYVPRENPCGAYVTRFTVDEGRKDLRYTVEMLDQSKHPYELTESGHTILHLDYQQSGIGSNSCGPVLAEEHRLDGPEFSFGFLLTLS